MIIACALKIWFYVFFLFDASSKNILSLGFSIECFLFILLCIFKFLSKNTQKNFTYVNREDSLSKFLTEYMLFRPMITRGYWCDCLWELEVLGSDVGSCPVAKFGSCSRTLTHNFVSWFSEDFKFCVMITVMKFGVSMTIYSDFRLRVHGIM